MKDELSDKKEDTPRIKVAATLKEAGITLKEASRALRRNDAYLHQCLYRGSPRRLPEQMRYALADLLGCDQQLFLASNEIERQTRSAHHHSVLYGTEITATTRGSAEMMAEFPATKFQVASSTQRQTKVQLLTSANCERIAFMDTTENNVSGALNDEEVISIGRNQSFAMPIDFLRKITPTPSAKLRLITINGDSMAPILKHGDVVMLDCAQRKPSPPGIFIVDDGVGLVAKRLDLVPTTKPQMLRLTSENSVYANYQRRINEVRIVGRVVWFSRNF